MGKKMKNAPVYYALAQVRFNPLAALETYIPAIQEKLRKAGYPDFQPNQIATLVFGAQQIAKPSVVVRYLFLNAQKTAGFILDTGSIAFQTTDYDTFDPFLAILLEGLEVVHSEAGLSYSERIGIRFLDAVCPMSGETLSQYLQPYVLGLSEQLSGRDLVHSLSETRTQSGKTVLVGRAVILRQEKEGAAFPEDLQPASVKLIDKFTKVKDQYAIIDTDSWMEDRQNFDLKALETTCRALHSNMWRSFELMVTPHALKVWD
jgi:uncharacterized protein (TIGR04255 family)